jgi:hypothetical protein
LVKKRKWRLHRKKERKKERNKERKKKETKKEKRKKLISEIYKEESKILFLLGHSNVSMQEKH